MYIFKRIYRLLWFLIAVTILWIQAGLHETAATTLWALPFGDSSPHSRCRRHGFPQLSTQLSPENPRIALSMAAPDQPAYVPLTPLVRDIWSACVQARYHHEIPPANICNNVACVQARYLHEPAINHCFLDAYVPIRLLHYPCIRCFFCLECKEGGLCANAFNRSIRDGAHHVGHARLMIYSKSIYSSDRHARIPTLCVFKEELGGILGGILKTNGVPVARYLHGIYVVHYLRTRPRVTSDPKIHCPGCQTDVANDQDRQLQFFNRTPEFKLCSIECLLAYDLRMTTPLARPQMPPPASAQISPPHVPSWWRYGSIGYVHYSWRAATQLEALGVTVVGKTYRIHGMSLHRNDVRI